MNKIHFEKDLVDVCQCSVSSNTLSENWNVNKMISCNSSQVIITAHNCHNSLEAEEQEMNCKCANSYHESLKQGCRMQLDFGIYNSALDYQVSPR